MTNLKITDPIQIIDDIEDSIIPSDESSSEEE